MGFQAYEASQPAAQSKRTRKRSRVKNEDAGIDIRFSTVQHGGHKRHIVAIGQYLAAVVGARPEMPFQASFDPRGKVIQLKFGAGERRTARQYLGHQVRAYLPMRRGTPKKLGTASCALLHAANGVLEFRLPSAA